VCARMYRKINTSFLRVRANSCEWVHWQWHACVAYEEEDTCMSYEEEDTCMSYEEEDTCLGCDMRAGAGAR